jgi:hypothetical protein
MLVLQDQEFKSSEVNIRKFFTLAQISPPKNCQIILLIIFFFVDSDLAPFIREDLSQSEKLFEIKPPLKRFWLCALVYCAADYILHSITKEANKRRGRCNTKSPHYLKFFNDIAFFPWLTATKYF